MLLIWNVLGGPSATVNKRRDCKHNCTCRNIVYLLDTSGSIHRNDFERVKVALSKLLTYMCGNIHVAFMTFSHTLQMEFCFDWYSQSMIKDPISNISYRGGTTHTGKAIRCLHDNILTRDGFCQMNTDVDCLDIVVVTDGLSNGPLRYNESCREMDQIKYKWRGVVNVHAIGIGLRDRIEELECLATSFDSIFSVRKLTALEGLVNTTVEELKKNGNNYRCVKPACPYEFIKFH